MSYDDDDRYAEQQRRRRENIMEQRLRKSRGEEIDEELDGGGFDDDTDIPRTFSSGPRLGGYRPVRGGGGGCAGAVLYLVLGALVALLIGLFFINRAAGSIGSLFGGIPNIATIIITPTPVVKSGAAVVERIQQLSRLESASYTIEQVIEVRQDSNVPVIGNILAGDALLLIAHGTVVAGVDLGKLPADAISISPDGNTITMRVPPVQVFSSSLDSSKTRVYSRDRGLFAPDNKDLETQARQEAEQRILLAACEDGIMSRATDAAEVSLRQFLSLLDYKNVVVIPSVPAVCAAPAGGPAATPVAP
jgi:hypothetical protein